MANMEKMMLEMKNVMECLNRVTNINTMPKENSIDIDNYSSDQDDSQTVLSKPDELNKK